LMEEMDDLFFSSYFSNPDGNYYKCDKAFLFYQGNNPETYRGLNVTGKEGRQVRMLYDQQEGNGNYSDLVSLVEALDPNITSDAMFPATINQVFDVDMYLRTLVVEICTGNPDSYTGRGNNWGMYHDPSTGKFVFLPFDYDETFNPTSNNWDTFNMYKWGEISVPYPPLTYRILKVPEFRDSFTQYFYLFLEKVFNPTGPLFQRIDLYNQLLSFEVMKDQYFTLDYSRTYVNYLQEAQNLKSFVQSRYTSALTQLDPQPDQPTELVPSQEDNSLVITLAVLGSVTIVAVVIGTIVILRRYNKNRRYEQVKS